MTVTLKLKPLYVQWIERDRLTKHTYLKNPMTVISLIAAIDENFGLGKDNHLLCHLPADLKHFKSITMGKPIIMGHRTFDSIGKPLPGRRNIVLSRRHFSIEGADLVQSLEHALTLVNDAPEVMIIGGASLYQQTLSQASRLYLTQIHHLFSADVFFPSLNQAEWLCKGTSFYQQDEKNPYDMTFNYYERQ